MTALPPQSEWLNTVQVSSMSGLAPKTVRLHIGRGNLFAVKWGNKWVTTREWVREWMRGESVEGTQRP